MSKLLVITLLTASLWAGGATLFAQSPEVPVSVQYPLYCKALSFDRSADRRCENDLVIALLHQNRNKDSREALRDIEETVIKYDITTFKGSAIRLVRIDIEDTNWPQIVRENHVDILYLLPVRSFDVAALAQFAKEEQLLTLSADPENVRNGLSVGLELRNSKPKFVFNLSAFREEGSDFTAQLLDIAEVIR